MVVVVDPERLGMLGATARLACLLVLVLLLLLDSDGCLLLVRRSLLSIVVVVPRRFSSSFACNWRSGDKWRIATEGYMLDMRRWVWGWIMRCVSPPPPTHTHTSGRHWPEGMPVI